MTDSAHLRTQKEISSDLLELSLGWTVIGFFVVLNWIFLGHKQIDAHGNMSFFNVKNTYVNL